MTHQRATGKKIDDSREGAVMLVVMLVLLSVTALAVFAAQATGYELRASGYARQTMQASYVSEAGLTTTLALVDQLGPRAVLHSMDQTTTLPVMAPFEPELNTTKDAYRFFSADVMALAGAAHPPVAVEVLGPRQAYTPAFTVDVNDHYISAQAIPGQRSDGLARLNFLHATYTARGRMFVTGLEDVTEDMVGPDPRHYHETASGSRAYGISGPYAQ